MKQEEEGIVDSRYKRFQRWLNIILSVEFPDSVEAINFNIYEDGNNYWSIELIGAGSFDEENEDWACDEVITTRADSFAIKYNATWQEVQGLFADYIRHYLDKGLLADRLKKYKAVAVGFVDGNISILYKN